MNSLLELVWNSFGSGSGKSECITTVPLWSYLELFSVYIINGWVGSLESDGKLNNPHSIWNVAPDGIGGNCLIIDDSDGTKSFDNESTLISVDIQSTSSQSLPISINRWAATGSPNRGL